MKNRSSKSPSSNLSYQNFLTNTIGEIGRAQILIYCIHLLPFIAMSWGMITISIGAGPTNWWKDSQVYNETANEIQVVRTMKDCSPLGPNDTITYANSYTIISEWSLICDLDYIPTWIKTSQMIGLMFGAILIGQLGDWIGRKRCVWLVLNLNILFLVIQAFSTSWIMMLISIFMLGVSSGAFMPLSMVYPLEFIGTSYRSIAFLPFWPIGVIILGGLVEVLPSWRHIYILAACFNVPFSVLMRFTPESIRWLLAHGKTHEAVEILNIIANINKLPPIDEIEVQRIVEKTKSEEKKSKTMKYNYFTLFKYESTRWKVLIFGFCWFCVIYFYYALTFGVSLLPGSSSANMSLMGLGDFLSTVLLWLLSKKLGRKHTTMLLYSLLAISSFIITIGYVSNSTDAETIKRVFSLISRLFTGSAWLSLAVFAIETFPTVIRSTAYSFVATCGRVGGIVSPQLVPLYYVSKHLPYTINGVLGVLCVIGLFFLHDTYSQDLQDQLVDEHEMKSANKSESDDVAV